MSSTSQSIVEAVFNTSTQFTLQSPRADNQLHYEFINFNEMTPSFNQEKFKEFAGQKIQTQQSDIYPEVIQSPYEPHIINRDFLRQIDLLSNNFMQNPNPCKNAHIIQNYQITEGYKVHHCKNHRSRLLAEIEDRQQSPSVKGKDHYHTIKEQKKNEENQQNNINNIGIQKLMPSFKIDLNSITNKQNQEDQDIGFKKQNNKFNYKCLSARNSPQRYEKSPIKKHSRYKSQLGQNQEVLLERLQQQTERVHNEAPTYIKSYSQVKLNSLRSSQNRKYFKREESQKLPLQSTQNNRQKSCLITLERNKCTLENKENQNNALSQKYPQQKQALKTNNQNSKDFPSKYQLKTSLQAINNNNLISQYFEQRVNKVINKFHNKIK